MKNASVSVRNKFDVKLRVQVLHQYTGEATQDSNWHVIEPNEEANVLSVQYNTGFFTTGVDNWIVNATELSEIEGKTSVGPFEIDGKVMFGVKKYQSGKGFGSQWKVHTLRDDDADQVTYIDLRPGIVEFISKSGTSSTTFDLEIIPHVL
eukprot:TRINITY_DN5923_c0_g1_i3.p1 TRINITY_DN5923_c0_g1~~TRINITY_DN5923_c0_g1_i3.p1  ORF type:complete len:150 (-),score=29.99 TRINITY_DN5923_c0_g1_i3:71-520(-)